jgi:uncharacterized protein (TIGR04255 family)
MKSFEKNLRTKHKDGFKQHILRMVLVRFDFAPLFAFENVAGKFQKEFSALFPEATIEQSASYDIEASKPLDPKLTIRDPHKVFCLTNNAERKKIKFSPTSLILEHHKYVSYDDFLAEFKKVFDFVFSQEDTVFSPTRIGLRKINSFILPEAATLNNFDGYFEPGLMEHLKLPFLSKSLVIDQHFLKFALEDGLEVNFQFSTEKGKKDNSDSRRFVLDLDIYKVSLSSDSKTCFENLDKMNATLFDLFWCSIGPKTEAFLASDGGGNNGI